MVRRSFEWDLAKARANERKHGISFETASRVFADPLAVIEQDRIEGGEYRWQAIGMVKVTLLVVAHIVWDEADEEIIRIISARRAERHERKQYEENG